MRGNGLADGRLVQRRDGAEVETPAETPSDSSAFAASSERCTPTPTDDHRQVRAFPYGLSPFRGGAPPSGLGPPPPLHQRVRRTRRWCAHPTPGTRASSRTTASVRERARARRAPGPPSGDLRRPRGRGDDHSEARDVTEPPPERLLVLSPVPVSSATGGPHYQRSRPPSA